MLSIETRLNEALAMVATLQQENKQLKVTVTVQRIRAARAEREMIMRERGLSETQKQNLHQAFSNSTDNAGLREAINVTLKRGAI